MINFPTSLDTLTNPTSTDLMENAVAALDHDVQHSNANDAIEALEAKVGVNSSAVTTSHDYKLSGVTGSAKALTSGTSTQSVTNLTLVTPTLSLTSDATGDMYYRNSGGALTRLPIGTSGQIIQTSSGGIPEWIANPAAADATYAVKGVATLDANARYYAADAGSNDTYAITLSPAPSSYTTGMKISFKANTINTGAATLNVNSLGAKTIVKGVNTTLADGDIAAGMLCTVIYDGTNFVLQNPNANTITPTTDLSAYTPNTHPTNTSIYHTYTAFPSVYNDGGTYRLAGAKISGTLNFITSLDDTGAGGGSLYLQANNSGAISSMLPSLASTASYRLLWSEIGTNEIRIRMRVAPKGTGTSPTYGWGLADTTEIHAVYNSTGSDGIRFAYDGTNLYAVSSKVSVGNTNTNVTGGLTISGKWHIYEIVITSSSNKFYIDGILVATHTTNLPNGSGVAQLCYGQTAGSTCEMAISPAIISMPNTAS